MSDPRRRSLRVRGTGSPLGSRFYANQRVYDCDVRRVGAPVGSRDSY